MRLKEINLNEFMNMTIVAEAIITNVVVGITKTKKPMLTVTLRDGNFCETAKCFDTVFVNRDCINGVPKELTPGNLVKLELKIGEYNDNISIIINNFELSEEDVNDYKEVFRGYNSFCKLYELLKNNIKDPTLSSLLTYETDKYFDRFKLVPAGKSMHHTEIGACLGHSVTIAQNAIKLAENYNALYGKSFIDVEVMVASALLHDYMKINEYEFDELSGACDMSENSAIESHITMMLDELMIAGATLGITGNSRLLKVKHCIASHHGELEFGSPVRPACPEAVLLNRLDMLDMDMWIMNSLKEKLKGEKSVTEFKGGKRYSYYNFEK